MNYHLQDLAELVTAKMGAAADSIGAAIPSSQPETAPPERDRYSVLDEQVPLSLGNNGEADMNDDELDALIQRTGEETVEAMNAVIDVEEELLNAKVRVGKSAIKHAHQTGDDRVNHTLEHAFSVAAGSAGQGNFYLCVDESQSQEVDESQSQEWEEWKKKDARWRIVRRIGLIAASIVAVVLPSAVAIYGHLPADAALATSAVAVVAGAAGMGAGAAISLSATRSLLNRKLSSHSSRRIAYHHPPPTDKDAGGHWTFHSTYMQPDPHLPASSPKTGHRGKSGGRPPRKAASRESSRAAAAARQLSEEEREHSSPMAHGASSG